MHLVAAVLLVLLGSCTSIVRPPAAPADPVATYLLLSGRHRGLWLPQEKGGFVEYGYGDWNWYARLRDSWYHVFPTMLWPTRSTLGRRFESAVDGEALRRTFPHAHVDELLVERDALESLRGELDALFAEHEEGAIYNDVYDMDFVPLPRGYWLPHNCYDVVGDWLETLGCCVSRRFLCIDLVVRAE